MRLLSIYQALATLRVTVSPTGRSPVSSPLRIFYAACESPNPAITSNGWRSNLRDSLVAMGHDVVEFAYDLDETARYLDPANPGNAAFIASNRPRLSAALRQQCAAAHARAPLDLFLSYFYDACVEPDTIDAIRAMRIVAINWYCNASYQLHLVKQIAPHYDYCLVPEANRLDDYRALGATPIYCQEAANPARYHPHAVAPEFDVTFVGQCYGDRAEQVMWLRKVGVDVRVWGPRWEHHVQPRSRNPFKRWWSRPTGLPRRVVGGILSDTELVAMYSRSKINLGFSTCGDTHRGGERIVQIRLRDFEVPMSGGFYLVEHQDELAEFFDLGREIETYRSREEMVDKIRFYLADEGARERVRQAGRARCLRDHTWERRFASVFQEIGVG
jgi:spore maturation protein CgeB